MNSRNPHCSPRESGFFWSLRASSVEMEKLRCKSSSRASGCLRDTTLLVAVLKHLNKKRSTRTPVGQFAILRATKQTEGGPTRGSSSTALETPLDPTVHSSLETDFRATARNADCVFCSADVFFKSHHVETPKNHHDPAAAAAVVKLRFRRFRLGDVLRGS